MAETDEAAGWIDRDPAAHFDAAVLDRFPCFAGIGYPEMIDRHIFGHGEAIMGFYHVDGFDTAHPGARAGFVDGPLNLRENIRSVGAVADFLLIGNRRRPVAPARNARQAFQSYAMLVGILLRPFFRCEKHDGSAVGHLSAIHLASAAFDDGIGLIIAGEAFFGEGPASGLGVGIALGVAEINLGNPHQMLIFQTIACFIFLGEIGEGPRPDIVRILIFLSTPRGGAKMIGCDAPRHVAHLFQSHDARQIIAAGFYFRHGGKNGDAARCAGRFVPCGGKAIERGVRLSEKSAEHSLSGKKFRNKIADMAGFDIFRVQLRLRQALVERVRKYRGNVFALPLPILSKIGLPAT